LRAIFLAATAVGVISADMHVALNPLDGAMLPVEAVRDVLHQCSRTVPTNVRATWQPRKEQIADLERLLPAALHAATSSFRGSYRSASNFRRQYLGIVSGDQKLIYVNAFSRDSGDPASSGPATARNFDWHRDAVVVCDGGPAFFGVEYDPATKSFDHFEFNGSP
jgi:hypothetical protein